MEALHLPGKAKQTALRIRRTHTVHIILIVQGRPQKHGLSQSLGNISRGFLVAEIAVDDHHRVHFFLLEAFHYLGGGGIVKHQVFVANALVIHKGHVLIRKILFYVLGKPLASLLGRVPGEERSPGAVGGVAAHCHKADLYFIIQHFSILLAVFLYCSIA